MPIPDVSALVACMKERHNIYLRRKDGRQKPWTEDLIFQNYKFCNTYRELDTVTIWIRENIREAYSNHPALWFLLCAARQINWPETLEEIIADKKNALPIRTARFDPERMRSIMLDRQARGEKLYTGAYMINAKYGEKKEWDKAYVTSHVVLSSLWEDRRTIEKYLGKLPTLEGTVTMLSGYHGWGGFMSYEVVSDMRWTRYLSSAKDICTWANPGPGAKRGLNRVYERPVRAHLNYVKAVEEMRVLFSLVKKKFPKPSKDWPAIEMREIEHSLCEYDKYMRTKLGEGRPRSKYQGGY